MKVSSSHTSSPTAKAPAFQSRIFAQGEMADLTRAFDWSQTPLGPMQDWPDALVTTVNMLLATRHPMFLWWGDELIQFYNDAYRPSITGGKHPKALGQRGVECWPEIWPVIGPQIEAVMSRGEASWHEDQFLPIYRNGKLEDVYWTYSYSPVFDASGKIVGTLVACSETTGRVVAEQGLRESEARLRLAQSAGELATWDWELETGKVVWSDGSSWVYGAPPEIMDRIDRCAASLHPEDRLSTMNALQHSIDHHIEYNHEFRVVWPDGSIHWLVGRGKAVYSPDGKPERVLGINWDITERRRAQEELRSERARLIELFQQSPAFVALLRGKDHVFEMVNPLFQALIGDRDVIGKTVRDALPEADEQGYGGFLDHAYQTGDPFVAHGYRIDLARNADQPLDERYVDFVYQPRRDADGEVSGIIVLGVDVTERKRSEQALRNAEKLAVVGRLAASIAHEINNPLAAVTNLLFLIGNEDGTATSKIYVDLAQKELARVANIVTQTLRFHRQSTHARSTSLPDVIDSVVTLFQGKAANAGITIKKQYETDLPIVAYDGDLRQAFTNLLANSLDASETGGGVIIRVREATDWATGDSGVRVIFADAGHGMSPTTKARIFEPFFTTKVSTGTGLGLWVTSEILQNHRARINVRSSQSSKSGTVFSIFFPLNGLTPS